MPVHRNEDGRVIEEPTRRKQESGRREGGGGAGEAPGSVLAPTVFSGDGGDRGAGKGDRFGVPPTRGPGRGDPATRIHRPPGGGSVPEPPPGGAGEEGRFGVSPTVGRGRGEPPTRQDADGRTIVSGLPTREPARPDPPGRPIGRGRPAPDPMADPPVGWLVVVAGPGKGHVATLGMGQNSVGRGPKAHVPLDYGDATISRTCQCTITYDPDDRTFEVERGEGRNLTKVDGKKVPGAGCELKPLARLQMGATVLRFVPLCGPEFSWDDEPE